MKLFKPTNKHSSESIWEVEYKTGQAEGLGSPFYTLFSPASYAPRNKANSNGYIPSPISNQGNGACAPTGYFMDMAKKWDSMYPDYQYEVRKFDDVIYTDTRISDGNIKLDTDGISYLPVNENKDYTQTSHILTTLILVPLSGLLSKALAQTTSGCAANTWVHQNIK